MIRRFQPTRREDGSILVELALVVPVLMLLVAGMIEVGAAWRDKSTVIQASRQSARVASHLGTDMVSDQLGVQGALAILPGGGGLAQELVIQRIVIYDASISDAQRDACIETAGSAYFGSSGRCNVYSEENGRLDEVALALPANFDDSGTAWDSEWKATSRSDAIDSPTEVGVYIVAFRPYLTDFFPGTGQRISAFTVMRVEPSP